MVCHDILHYQSVQMQHVTKEIMYAQSNVCNECNKATNLKHMENLIAQVYYGH